MSVNNFDGDGFANQLFIRSACNDSDRIVEPATLAYLNISAIAAGRPLGNSLSHSTSQIELQAKGHRLNKRGRCLDTSCFFANQYKRLPSESHSSVSRSDVWARRDDATHREACQHQPTIETNRDSTTTTR
jgi:hypothetical protein